MAKKNIKCSQDLQKNGPKKYHHLIGLKCAPLEVTILINYRGEHNSLKTKNQTEPNPY